ncbi:gamma-glutamylcyclotransferase [Thalassomonas viridans]|uniref:Gamma-glutamylcyclotransferase n=1 Tax=Thalassomonas viridans TaxID=137584 RepID=A0AAF0C9Z2_9GAMM|nr:gamma-glutamylcyclotransferase family protein [Thalassomonas viridans]WDE08037.1 gamma-glutamylcyclotransferase [Thalassomonas viridans]
MKYFAYGSNMSVRRLKQRALGANCLGVFALTGHDLRFHKTGEDGSAKCDAFYTGSECDYIYGVLFEITAQEKRMLDQIEGLGCGYEEKQVCVANQAGFTVNAVMYYASHIDTSLKPFFWYKNHVVIGAKESRLPPGYIEKIIQVEGVEDPDQSRNAQQRALYDGMYNNK